MKLSKQAIKEFKEIYQEEFGIDIPYKEANELGLNLLNLFKIIYQPISKGEKMKKETRARIYTELKALKKAIKENCKDCDPEHIGCGFNCPLEPWKPKRHR